MATSDPEALVTEDDAGATGTLLSIGEASQFLNVCGNTLRRWSDVGIISTYRTGIRRRRRFKREDIVALLIPERTEDTQPDAWEVGLPIGAGTSKKP